MLEENMEEETEQNLSEGYCIKIYVRPNGFQISDPQPMEEEDEDYGELVESPSDMLKHILAIVKSNPVEPSEAEGFDESMAEPQGKPQEY